MADTIFPNTRPTLMKRLKNPNASGQWNSSWEEFFDAYHQAVRVCVLGVFRKSGWYSVCDADVQDVVMAVFESILKGLDALELDPAKGRFRQFLSTVCQRRVVDFIRSNKGISRPSFSESPVEEATRGEAAAAHEDFAIREKQAFRRALLGIVLADLHREVSPQVYMIFERVKLAGESPDTVAAQLEIKRGVVDNSIYKAMQELREIALRPEISQEF